MSTVGDPADLRPLGDLPDAVRQRLVEWASQALGAATPTEIPSTLSRFARSAPAKRAKLAAGALIAALQSDPAFRSFVAGRSTPSTSDATVANDTAGEDPIAAAARAVLLRLPDRGRLAGSSGDGVPSIRRPGKSGATGETGSCSHQQAGGGRQT